MTTFDILRPAVKQHAWLYDAACISVGSLFIALSAQVAVRVPFSPVPITGQTMAALLVGMLLGSRRGALCLLLYLAEGTLGLPVFAGGGLGLARLAGPTGGYLVGLLAAAFVTGSLAERGWDRRARTALLAMVLGNAVIYAFGLPWLALYVGPANVLAMGFLPFAFGDAIKVVLAAMFLPAALKSLAMPK